MDHHQLSVERVVPADSAAIFALLSDASRHAEIDGSGTVQGLRGESEPLALGSVFGMSMKRGIGYTTKNTVVEVEQDRRIAWRTTGFFGLVGGRVWRYELEPADGGTLVRETWDVSRDRQRWVLERSNIPGMTKNNMRATLDRLAERFD